MFFIDIGCGEGFFSLPAARLAGPGGRIHAIDINPDAVACLREQAAKEGLLNLSVELNEAETAVTCEECADIVFFGNDLHDFSDPAQVIQNARTMLKPGGRLADLDWKNIAMDFGPPLEKRFSPEKASAYITSGGFTIRSTIDTGPYHYLIIAEK
jgi:SAM-dependent methyltransferase